MVLIFALIFFSEPEISTDESETKLETRDNQEYQFFPNLTGIIKFKVKAPKDARIALVNEPSEKDPIYEIFIGGDENSTSLIRKNKIEPGLVKVKTPDILDPHGFRSFWISWQNKIISVGKENEATPFLSWTLWTCEDEVNIQYVGLSTGSGAAGSWIIHTPKGKDSGDKPVLKTEDKLEYQFMPNCFGLFKFMVKAPNDARVALTTTDSESNPMYEIFIGTEKNTKSVIRKNKAAQDVAKADTPNILDPGDFLCFWIRWKGPNITVGSIPSFFI
ncbi:hypothetical protein JTB14_023425 [Gonioctena quinquepunctata]|nr:hypothetical protein JTB14_023425 [Gonioctena quinquepunctata]